MIRYAASHLKAYFPVRTAVLLPAVGFPGFTSLGIADREVVEYVVDLLTSFARTDQLYRIRDLRGQPLETIAEMMVELGRQRQPERRWSFDREMDIRRHVGDYALFTTGLFRTWVERQGLGGYYLEQGRRAYGAAAELAQLGFVSQARLFGALEEQFEHLSGGSTTCARSICGPNYTVARTGR